MATVSSPERTVALVTLGCTRNEVDSEELAGRLQAEGWTLVDDAAEADVAVVNTCGFVEQAKKDSIDTLLGLPISRSTAAPRRSSPSDAWPSGMARSWPTSSPDADAVLGFDSYDDMSGHLRRILAGEKVASHVPSDRRRLLPLSPVAARQDGAGAVAPARSRQWGGGRHPGPARHRPVGAAEDRERLRPAMLLLCDPDVSGSFVSRRPTDVIAEARWLGSRASRNSSLSPRTPRPTARTSATSPSPRRSCPSCAKCRASSGCGCPYLQPAEIRPGLLEAMAGLRKVMPWYDLSFQHASPTVLRRMRRFGGTEHFLRLIDGIREREPRAGIRTNVIVGFPGETESDVEELESFLVDADLDVIGVFGYSDEDGTEAEHLGTSSTHASSRSARRGSPTSSNR